MIINFPRQGGFSPPVIRPGLEPPGPPGPARVTEIIDAYTIPGTERDTDLSASRLLGMMDDAGITRAVIAPQDRELAVRCAEGNARVLGMAEASRGSGGGGRFIPACTANPWLGGDAIRIVRDAVAAGAKMLVIAPAIQGFILTDDLTDHLFADAAAMRLPVYVHTGPHSHSGPSQLALVALRHAQTRFILGHGGSTDHAYDMFPVIKMGLPNLWFETSLIRPFALPRYGAAADEDRLLFGTSAPRNIPAHELQHTELHWPRAQHPAMYGANLLRLLAEVRTA